MPSCATPIHLTESEDFQGDAHKRLQSAETWTADGLQFRMNSRVEFKNHRYLNYSKC
jgi:hypothetical protein